MKIKFSPVVIKDLAKIKKKDKKLEEKIHKQLKFFVSNPQHPSLRLHKLTGTLSHTWSISITMDIRMLYRIIDDETVYFIDIGTHDEVYSK